MAECQSIEQLWTACSTHVLPDGCDDIQRRDVRNAFFAGACALLDQVTGPFAELPDDECMERLSRYIEERDAFFAELEALPDDASNPSAAG